jgi:hypothetical protein
LTAEQAADTVTVSKKGGLKVLCAAILAMLGRDDGDSDDDDDVKECGI